MPGPCETCPFILLSPEELEAPCLPLQMPAEVRAQLDTDQLTGALDCVSNRLVIAERRAQRDPLTDLDRYDAFQERLQAVYSHEPRAGEVVVESDGTIRRPLLAISADGNKFGQVNKVYGHDQGDVALHAITEPFRRIRDNNAALTGRRGGDELVAAVLGLDYPEAADFCASFTNELATGKTVEMANGFLVLTVGVAAVYGADVRTHEQATELFKLADRFLVDSKQRTRVQEATARSGLEHSTARMPRLRRVAGALALVGRRRKAVRHP